MSPSKAAARPVLNRRRAARFAAVQALYQIELGQVAATEVVAEFGEHRLAQLLEAVDDGPEEFFPAAVRD